MEWPRLVSAIFIRRDNRFRATVIAGGKEVKAHVPNSGRLGDLFSPGCRVWLRPSDVSERKTVGDLVLVEQGNLLVSVDARLPNRLFAEALSSGHLSGFPDAIIEAEVKKGESRCDFRLRDTQGRICWVETKSVTLVEGGTALFPDAPTARGRKHVQALMRALEDGEAAAMVFVVQRPDAQRFSPHPEVDVAFRDLLRQAAAVGVIVRAFRCDVNPEEIRIKDEIPVILDV